MNNQSKSISLIYVSVVLGICLAMPIVWIDAVNNPVAGGASPVVSAGAPAVRLDIHHPSVAQVGAHVVRADINHPLKISNTTTEDVTIRYKTIKDSAEVELSATIKPNQSLEVIRKPGSDVIYTSKDCTNCLLTGDGGGAAVIQAKK